MDKYNKEEENKIIDNKKEFNKNENTKIIDNKEKYYNNEKTKIFDNKDKYNNNEKTKIFDNKENINNALQDKPNEEYKNEINELEKRIKELEIQLEEKDKIIKEEKIKNNSLTKKILELEIILNNKEKPKEIIELEKEINLFRSYYNFSSEDKLISIKFISIYQDINFELIAKNSDEFSKLEKLLYDNYPKYKDTENYFLYNGKKINRNRTLRENDIKDESKITLGINDFA